MRNGNGGEWLAFVDDNLHNIPIFVTAVEDVQTEELRLSPC